MTRALMITLAAGLTLAGPGAAGAASRAAAGQRLDTRASLRQATDAAIAASAPTAGAASGAVAGVQRLSFRGPQLSALLVNPPPKAAPEWTVEWEADLPAAYNSNPEHAASGVQSDGHSDPSLGVTFTRKSPAGDLKVSLTGDVDLNFSRRANDSTTFEGEANYSFPKKVLGGDLSADYTVDEARQGRFGRHDATNNTFALALDYTIPVGAKATAGAPATGSDDVKGPSLALTFAVARVQSTKSDSELTKGDVKAVLSGRFPGGLGWSLTEHVVAKSYTGGANKDRNDIISDTIAAISHKFSETAAFSFTVLYERNSSDQDGSGYSYWEIGPKLTKTF